jgi:hypothetical protein
MIEIFGSQSPTGANPQQLAHGISMALYNTGFGLVIAIPEHDLLAPFPCAPMASSSRWSSRRSAWSSTCTATGSKR